MKKLNNYDSPDSSKPIRRATTPEARENQMIALAVDLAEKQLREGTASSQVITHYLKLGSTKEKLEKEILIEQKKMIQEKTKTLEADRHSDELYSNAIAAMRKYKGFGESEEDENS